MGEPGAGEAAAALERMRRSPLQAPVRLAVMLLLASRARLEFEELRRALGVTPGNLWSHLERLQEHGLVRLYYKPAPGRGPRLIVEATEQGVRELLAYLQALRSLEALALGEGAVGEGVRA